jgi:2-keto-4-pentenoate hydratase
MGQSIDDPRILRGMTRLLETRRKRLDAGETSLGWKVGFGAPAPMARLGITKPLIGFMMEKSRVAPGAAVSLRGWTKPIAEPEIAIHFGRDLSGEVSADEAKAAIAGLGPAIELVDLDGPADDPDVILTGNIFHRRVALGAPSSAQAGAKLDGLTGRVFRRSVEAEATSDLEANTGKLIDIARNVAATLGAFGEKISAGEVLIAGSVVLPIVLEADETSVAFALEPIGRISIGFSRA